MIKNHGFDRDGASLKDAIAAGYDVELPKVPSPRLNDICHDLGGKYHRADSYGECIHRVLGNGHDLIIYPRRNSKKLDIVLRREYGQEIVDCIDGVMSYELSSYAASIVGKIS